MAHWIAVAPQVVTCGPSSGPRTGAAMAEVGVVVDGAVVIEDDTIRFVGPEASLQAAGWTYPVTRFEGAIVPGLCDAHTHPVWAGDRLDEFRQRAQGVTYEAIHAQGGGIAATVRATRVASDTELAAGLRAVLDRMLRHGTTTAECKSGYGLTPDEERRHLAVLRSVRSETPMTLVATFLGAHAVPPEYTDAAGQYIDLMVDMLPGLVSEGLAEYCDVFCEEGAFSWEESRRLLLAAREAGLGVRIHAEEFTYRGSARQAAELGAISCDHLLCIRPGDFETFRRHGTIATLMPGTAFFLGKADYAPARALIDGGVAVALATDFNAGSCMSESMAMAMSLGVLKMGMSPEEALVAATINGAAAVGRAHQVGSLEVGKRADFLVLDVPDYRAWPYHFGVNLVRTVVCGGQAVEKREGERA